MVVSTKCGIAVNTNVALWVLEPQRAVIIDSEYLKVSKNRKHKSSHLNHITRAATKEYIIFTLIHLHLLKDIDSLYDTMMNDDCSLV